MQASTIDSVLIEQVVYLASLARQATGQDPIFDLPKGESDAYRCPIARALNLKCSVQAGSIFFLTKKQATLVAQAVGGTAWERKVTLPPMHPFRRFVVRFDRGSTKQMRALEAARW